MFFNLKSVALGAAVLSNCHSALALSPADIPADLPVSQLVSNANARLAAGNAQEALTYFDVAISRDPQNYLTLFKRGATYLSLGRNSQAKQDFDKVLTMKPDFEGALLQRAKIKSRAGEWAAARKDYEAAGKSGGAEIEELEEAQGAAVVARDLAERGDWENCVTQAGVAIAVAGMDVELRSLRAKCRFEKGEIMEGVSDLQHVVQISSGSTEPHMKISAMTFYSLGETDKGLAQIRQCLHSDPDSRSCMKLMKQEKYIAKQLNKVNEMIESRQFAAAVKLLIKQKDDDGLIQEIKEDTMRYKEEGLIHQTAPEVLYTSIVEKTCDAYISMNNRKRAAPYCDEALQYNPGFFNGLILKAENHLEVGEFEDAIRTLNDANEHHPRNQRIAELLNKAHLKLRISKQKDYYKVLGVARDADEREIKKAYRKLTMQYHPDKAGQNGMDKDEAEKKMAELNSAYEVLSDPELRARFDRGDDPNNPENQGNPFQGSPFGGGGQQFFFNPGQGNPFGSNFKFHQGGGFPGGGGRFPF